MKFVDNLISIKYPTEIEKKDLWDVSGILKYRSNQEFKFDLRPLDKNLSKRGFFKTKADKMVFEKISEWIVVDIKELHSYIKQHNLKVVKLEDLISKLDWNIILPKK